MPSHCESWRCAAHLILNLDETLFQGRTVDITLGSKVDDDVQLTVRLNPGAAIILNPFECLFEKLGKAKKLTVPNHNGAQGLQSLADGIACELLGIVEARQNFLDAAANVFGKEMTSDIVEITDLAIYRIKELLLDTAARMTRDMITEVTKAKENLELLGLEQTVESASVINAELKKNVMKVIDSKEGKEFKNMYKAMTLVKLIPNQMFVDVNDAFGGRLITEKTFANFDSTHIDRVFALCAIAQSTLRTLKSGEKRSIVVQGAKDCEAVTSAEKAHMIPPKFAMLLSGTFPSE